MKALDTIHKGEKGAEAKETIYRNFDYGPLNIIKKFDGTHPKVMKDWINKFDWTNELQYSGKPSKTRKKHAHEKLKYRILSFVENILLGGNTIGGFKNYTLLKR